MQTRIYVVIHKKADGEHRRLVEATSAAAAIKHCTNPIYTAKTATPKEVAELMKHGCTIEHANEQPAV